MDTLMAKQINTRLVSILHEYAWVSLVAQWLRIHLPMQEMQVRSLSQEDPLE